MYIYTYIPRRRKTLLAETGKHPWSKYVYHISMASSLILFFTHDDVSFSPTISHQAQDSTLDIERLREVRFEFCSNKKSVDLFTFHTKLSIAIDFQWQTPILEVFWYRFLPLTFNGKVTKKKTCKIGVCHWKSMAKTQTWQTWILESRFLPLTFNGKHLFWRFSGIGFCHWLSMAKWQKRKPAK